MSDWHQKVIDAAGGDTAARVPWSIVKKEGTSAPAKVKRALFKILMKDRLVQIRRDNSSPENRFLCHIDALAFFIGGSGQYLLKKDQVLMDKFLDANINYLKKIINTDRFIEYGLKFDDISFIRQIPEPWKRKLSNVIRSYVSARYNYLNHRDYTKWINRQWPDQHKKLVDNLEREMTELLSMLRDL